MSSFIPDGLPLLSEGAHPHPQEGACVMEYTALLAGEPFTDTPKCVDVELSYFMQKINDNFCDVHRQLLVPYLGRAIGLVAPNRPGQRFGPRTEALARDYRRWFAASRQLQQAVNAKMARRFSSSFAPGPELNERWYDQLKERVDSQCDRHCPRSKRDLAVIMRWVEGLHVCYEEAMADFGWEVTRELACELPQVRELIGT